MCSDIFHNTVFGIMDFYSVFIEGLNNLPLTCVSVLQLDFNLSCQVFILIKKTLTASHIVTFHANPSAQKMHSIILRQDTVRSYCNVRVLLDFL